MQKKTEKTFFFPDKTSSKTQFHTAIVSWALESQPCSTWYGPEIEETGRIFQCGLWRISDYEIQKSMIQYGFRTNNKKPPNLEKLWNICSSHFHSYKTITVRTVIFQRRQRKVQCVRSVKIQSFFWLIFSRIRIEYEEIRSISPYSVRIRENTDQKKIRILTLFTQSFGSQKAVGLIWK